MSNQPIMEWVRVPEAPAGAPSAWSPEMVKRRLVAAVDHAQRTAGPVGPRTGTASDVLARMSCRDWLFDIDPLTGAVVYNGPGVVERDEEGRFVRIVEPEEEGPKRRPPRYTPREVWNLEGALWWAGRYLKTDTTDWVAVDRLRTFVAFIRCRVFRSLRFGAVCRANGWPRRTAYDRVDAALAAIAEGLNFDGVEAWPLLNEGGDQWE